MSDQPMTDDGLRLVTAEFLRAVDERHDAAVDLIEKQRALIEALRERVRISETELALTERLLATYQTDEGVTMQ